jgi:hypothetical protein
MILPTKRIPQDRALLWVGAQILARLGENKTISRLWDEVRTARDPSIGYAPISFDWFTLALAFLFTANVVEISRGRLRKMASK